MSEMLSMTWRDHAKSLKSPWSVTYVIEPQCLFENSYLGISADGDRHSKALNDLKSVCTSCIQQFKSLATLAGHFCTHA